MKKGCFFILGSSICHVHLVRLGRLQWGPGRRCSVKFVPRLFSVATSSFVHSLHNYFFRIYCVSSTVLGTRDREVNKTDPVPVIMQLFICWGTGEEGLEDGAECGTGADMQKPRECRS